MNKGIGLAILMLMFYPVFINGAVSEVCAAEYETVLVKDIRPGFQKWTMGSRTIGQSSNPDLLTAFNDMLLFSADDGTHGEELWRSDGTKAGTVMVKDICQDCSANPWPHIEYKGELFFDANDGIHSYALWKTDGTEEGTVMVKDIRPGLEVIECNGMLFFAAEYNIDGLALWKSDGTEEGTIMVKVINPEPVPYDYTFTHFFECNGMVFFEADDGTHGYELWRSDGTEAGTIMVKDINPGSDSSYPDDFVVHNGMLFFRANDGHGTHGVELWRSDGTEAGTVMVKDISQDGSSYPCPLIDYNGMLLFTAKDDDTHGYELWRTDGTKEGTVMVKDINPGSGNSDIQYHFEDQHIEYEGMLLFIADDGTHGNEIWKTDGTEEGTVLVKDIWPGENPYFDYDIANGFFEYDGMLFFGARNGPISLPGLWKTDGTEEGTMPVKRNLSITGEEFFEYDDMLFFQNEGRIHAAYSSLFHQWFFYPELQLGVSDGTEAGTTNRLFKINPLLPFLRDFTQVNGTMYFVGQDHFFHGTELFKLQPKK